MKKQSTPDQPLDIRRPPEIIYLERLHRQDVDPSTGSSAETRALSLRIHPLFLLGLLTAGILILWLRPEALAVSFNSATKALKQGAALLAFQERTGFSMRERPSLPFRRPVAHQTLFI
jgi:hypothetical protein